MGINIQNRLEEVANIKKKNNFKKLKTTTLIFKGKEFKIDIKEFRNSIYLIIDGLFPLCLTQHEVLSSTSLVDNKIWYSYLGATEIGYLNVGSMRHRDDFCTKIKQLLKAS